MLAPIKWLEEYTDINVGVQEFCDRLILSGSNLETVDYYNKDIEGVVIGKVLSVEPHPNADKLTVCQIDVGRAEPVQICTGAPNIVPGMKDFFVPVAVDGAKVPGPLHGQPKTEEGVTIHAGQLRGVDSFGMLCSCSELGFDDKVVPVASRDGIWILPDEFRPGDDLVEGRLGVLVTAVLDGLAVRVLRLVLVTHLLIEHAKAVPSLPVGRVALASRLGDIHRLAIGIRSAVGIASRLTERSKLLPQ